MSIQLLPDHVANKIAAGEVVERPASVVKELVENALDAGSDQIDIEIIQGGAKLLRVIDNGCGMTRDDAMLCVERHATSKIRDVDDIERVGTLGFRGEALAAIPSVSRFSLVTRPHDAVGGTEIEIQAGKLVDVRDAGCPPGTSVTVRNLFFNVPARKKFMRSEQTELSHIRQVFLVHALAHPAVGMTLTVDGKPLHRFPAGGTLDERMAELFDADQREQFKPLAYDAAGIRVRGAVGLPTHHRSDRTGQYVFVNRRPAMAPLLGYAIRESFSGLVPRGRHPVLVAFIELDPALVDVNVHPTKREVRFRRPAAVRDAMMAAIRMALAPGAASEKAVPEPVAAPVVQPPQMPTPAEVPRAPSFHYPELSLGASGPSPTPVQRQEPQDGGKTLSSPWGSCSILGWLGRKYAILETEDGMVLLDPPAAHERVLFERYMRQIMDGAVQRQGLLAPETIELSPVEAAAVTKNLDVLNDMGFELSSFGSQAFLVEALPACLGDISAKSLIRELAQAVEQGGRRRMKWTDEAIAQTVCHTAVQRRDRLSEQELKRLVDDLAVTNMPYTCPHGRPTMIFMSMKELDRKFGRA